MTMFISRPSKNIKDKKLCFRCFEVFSPDQVCKTLFLPRFFILVQIFSFSQDFLSRKSSLVFKLVVSGSIFKDFLSQKSCQVFKLFKDLFLWQKSSLVLNLLSLLRFLVTEIVAGFQTFQRSFLSQKSSLVYKLFNTFLLWQKLSLVFKLFKRFLLSQKSSLVFTLFC